MSRLAAASLLLFLIQFGLANASAPTVRKSKTAPVGISASTGLQWSGQTLNQQIDTVVRCAIAPSGPALDK